MTGVQTFSTANTFKTSSSGLRGRWLAFRNRLIADPKFQRWAARFPLTKFIAERRARALFNLCAGFVYSQVLYACQAFGLFDKLSAAPASAAELAEITGLDRLAADRLIRAAVSLDLLEPVDDERFVLGQLGAAMAGNPAIGKLVAHHDMFYADLANPMALLAGKPDATALGEFWGYGVNANGPAANGGRGPEYSHLMSASQVFIAGDVMAAYDFSRHARMLDIGGGDGTFIQAVAGKHPHLDFMLFDLPAVARQARRKLRGADLDDRTEVFSGDFFSQELPRGADLVTLVRVVHDHDDGDVLRLFRNIRRMLPAGGRLIIAEPLAREQGDPIMDAYFGFYFLAMGSGRTRTPGEFRKLLGEAGFDHVKPLPTSRPMFCGLIMAQVGQ